MEFAVIVSVTLYKISCLAVGCLFCVLGYRLFLQGIVRSAGDLDAKIANVTLALKSAAPGTFFSLLGATIVVFTVWQGINFSWKAADGRISISTEKQALPLVDRPDLKPPLPPPENAVEKPRLPLDTGASK